MAGIIGPFLQAANRVTRVTLITHGETLARMNFQSEGSPYSFMAMVPQNVTENLLVQELRRKGGNIEYETTFVSAQQDDKGVTATLDKRGISTTLTANFVVGCDGAHSAVRHLLNMPFEAEYPDTFILADIESNDSLPSDELQLCPNEKGPLAIFPIHGNRRRIVTTIKSAQEDAPSLELVRNILAERAPSGFEALSMHWSAYSRIHHRHVAQLRRGRFFIAGDAAHIHSPFGGQGMNTGLQDVWNLVWKLDLLLRGLGNEQLIGSYSEERIPVIKSVIQTTDLLTKLMGTPSKFAQAIRSAVLWSPVWLLFSMRLRKGYPSLGSSTTIAPSSKVPAHATLTILCAEETFAANSCCLLRMAILSSRLEKVSNHIRKSSRLGHHTSPAFN